ncbi:putative F-box domain-containing protein [Rosa chinensis]|uniref:Putative F-box domain-containing protein n=1 Tax=Rosa chinensis TaxID=74649 RepID=A0A2P6R360_ROSCH|nr:putative F-box domain-containing protein [Rosa chinensis]
MEERVRKCKANRHSLSVEIEEDILSRLPVKSLCRFRCVSKSWRYLISDPKFVKLHRDRAFQSEHVFRQRQRVIYTNSPITSLPLCKIIRPLTLYSFYLNSNIETLDEYD